MSLSPNSTVPETPVETTKIFQFFELSKEIRDVIYDQPEMLEDKFLRTTKDLPHPSQVVGTKPRTNLRLICS
jgi:hypothetical protein